MQKEQQPNPNCEANRLRESYKARRDSERPVPYSIDKAYRLLIAAREDNSVVDGERSAADPISRLDPAQ